jgi:hypothetical protein
LGCSVQSEPAHIVFGFWIKDSIREIEPCILLLDLLDLDLENSISIGIGFGFYKRDRICISYCIGLGFYKRDRICIFGFGFILDFSY